MMDNVGPVQGLVAEASTIDDPRPTLFGTGHPGDVINLSFTYIGPSIGSTVVGADGKWSVRPDAALPDGSYAGIWASAMNAAGTASAPAKLTYWFTIDTTTPVAPAITGVADSLGSIIAPGGTTSVTRPVISGNGQAGHIVKVYDGSTLVGVANVDGYGHWTVQPATALSADVHNLSAVEFTQAGVPSVPSAHFLFLIDAPVLKSVMHVSETSDHSDAASVTGHEAIGHNADPAQSSTHAAAPGEVTSEGVRVLHVTSDHGIIDLASLAAKPVAAKASAADASDVTVQHGVLKLSLVDVLSAGEQDLFQKDGKQLMINGKEGDTVELSNSHVAGLADGEWQQHGAAQVSGVTYNVYEHSGARAELLVQQGTQIEVH